MDLQLTQILQDVVSVEITAFLQSINLKMERDLFQEIDVKDLWEI